MNKRKDRVGTSCRLDETHIKVKAIWCYKSTNDFIAVGDKMIVTIKVIDGDCFEFNRSFLNKKFDDGSDTKSFCSCIKKD